MTEPNRFRNILTRSASFFRKERKAIGRKWLAGVAVLLPAFGVSFSQYYQSQLAPPAPPPVSEYLGGTQIPDSVFLPSPVQTTIPEGYSALEAREYAADLRTPSNIKTEAIYDPESKRYYIHTKLGDNDIVTP